MHHARMLLLAALACTACDPGNVVLLTADQRTEGPPALTVHAVLDTPYAALADSLGWAGGIAGAEVRVHLMSEPYDADYWHVAVTDSMGTAVFSDLVAGLYEVEVGRQLTAMEVGETGDRVHVVGGGRRVVVPGPQPTELAAEPDHRGALTFSELGLTTPVSWETGNTSYDDAVYFELINNGDSTVYLDGKYWGVGWWLNRDFSYLPCTETAALRSDPDGIWTRYVFQFPGSGTEYPLAPGATALVAQAAVDHRPIHPGLYDLRQADFEWGGSANADNPGVPNTASVGDPMRLLEMPLYVADEVNLDGLPRYIDRYGYVWRRIPAEKVLDAWEPTWDVTTWPFTPSQPCREALHERFERLPGPAFEDVVDFNAGLSFQRRVLFTLPGGRKVLLDTNTSMFDFVKLARSPGWIP